jgi:hypothetical protein
LRQTWAKAVEHAARSAGARIPRDVRAIPAAAVVRRRARGGEKLMLSAPPVRSCSWASLRAGVPGATALPGSSGKFAPHPHRSITGWRCTRCTGPPASASVLPAPADGPSPVSGDMVASRLAWRGNEVPADAFPQGKDHHGGTEGDRGWCGSSSRARQISSPSWCRDHGGQGERTPISSLPETRPSAPAQPANLGSEGDEQHHQGEQRRPPSKRSRPLMGDGAKQREARALWGRAAAG